MARVRAYLLIVTACFLAMAAAFVIPVLAQSNAPLPPSGPLIPPLPSTPVEQSVPKPPVPAPVLAPADDAQMPVPPPPVGEDVRYITEDTRGERIFTGACGERLKNYTATMLSGGTSNDPLFSEFKPSDKADREILRALTTFCGTGRFLLGQLNDKGECVEVLELRKLHTDVIHRLMAIRPEPADLVAIGCVRTKETVKFWTFRGTGILIDRSTIQRVEINGAQIAYGVTISGGTKIPGGLSIDASSLGRLLDIREKSEIGTASKDDKDQTARTTRLDISRSAISGSFVIRDTTIHSQLSAIGNRIEGAVEFIDATFNSALNFRNSFIGGQLLFQDVAVKGETSFDSSSMRSLYVTRAKFEKSTSADFLKVEGEASIWGANFDGGLNLNRLAANELTITRSEFGTETAADAGVLQIAGATVNSITVAFTKIRNLLFAGNSRIGAFDIKAVTVPSFDCTDCIIEQYLLLGGEFSKEVRLWGAHIKSQLRLRERNYCARWTGQAIFDLRGLQTRSIAADYDDLKMADAPKSTSDDKKHCGTTTVRTLVSGASFEHVVSGLRSTSEPDKQPTDPHLVACAATANDRSIIDHGAEEILCWIERGLGKTSTTSPIYDPRPYQLIATALETAGRHEDAVEIRMAKITAEPKTITMNPWTWGRPMLDWLSYQIAGYGYHNEWAFYCFLGLVLIGAVIFWSGRLPHAVGMPYLVQNDWFGLTWYAIWFSVDRAVPPLALDTSMSEYSILKPWARNYFYIHRALGTVIITVAIASLTGVFK